MKTRYNISITLLTITVLLLIINFGFAIMKYYEESAYRRSAEQQRTELIRLLKNQEHEKHAQ